MGDTAKLSAGGGEFDYPVLKGSVGPDVVDIRKLYGQTGMFTYDPGFTSTASCESALTYIDGEEGVLLHRGYPIGQLAEESSFMETSYLLLNGELPSKTQLDEFTRTITRHTMLRRHEAQVYPHRPDQEAQGEVPDPGPSDRLLREWQFQLCHWRFLRQRPDGHREQARHQR